MQRDELYNAKIRNPGKLHRGNPEKTQRDTEILIKKPLWNSPA